MSLELLKWMYHWMVNR